MENLNLICQRCFENFFFGLKYDINLHQNCIQKTNNPLQVQRIKFIKKKKTTNKLYKGFFTLSDKSTLTD